MKVKVYRASMKSDGESLCLPSEGYEKTNTVDICLYKLLISGGGLPGKSDQEYPSGAPIEKYVFYVNSLYELIDNAV